MLILARKNGERIYIDGPCIVELCSIRGETARLGFVAAEETKILRTELLTHEATTSGSDGQ